MGSKSPPLSPTASAPDLDILNQTNPIHPPLVQDVVVQNGASLPPINVAVDTDETSRNLAQKHSHFRDHPIKFLQEIQMMASGTGWRAYDDYIGQPIFYKGFTDDMKRAILECDLVTSKIEELADHRVDEEVKQDLVKTDKVSWRRKEIVHNLQEVAEGMVDNMICKFESKRFIRVCGGSSLNFASLY